jgi:hypothetical protein
LTTDEILAKLQPTFDHEGLDVEVVRESGESLHIRARRTSPGVPVAFLVKAIAGTLRRYHESLREVVLEEYDAGENIETAKAEDSPEFAKVLQHRPHAVPAPAKGAEWMGLDLRGSDRAEAIKALEYAQRIWTEQERDRFLVRGLEEDPARRAWEKWSSFYSDLIYSSHPVEGGAMVVHLRESCRDPGCLKDLPVLWMPAHILVPQLPPGSPEAG